MIEFVWPWVWLLLPLPIIAWLILPASKSNFSAALKVPFYDSLATQPSESSNRYRKSKLLIASLLWLLLIIAAAQPQWIGEPIELPTSGRDLMLAVDLSGSMEMPDMQINRQAVDRLTMLKYVLSPFIKGRSGDRIGLILFGEQAYLQTPLTFDRVTLSTMLDESAIGLAGKQTAIGDAIGLAVKRLKEQAEESRVLILLTDGQNTAGQVTPIAAAKLAQQYGIKIYTIGIGATAMQRRSFFGSTTVNPSADLDEKTLKEIAQTTGGQYFRAKSTEDLIEISKSLDQLEPTEKEKEIFRPIKSLFFWPLGIAFVLSTLSALFVSFPLTWRALS